ncbi:MAG: MATE family efflux transporter [Clostridia bacterium]|nr:MATE family efflux transporter [Clostridia bacterium]
MELLTGNIRRLYLKYLAASFGSTLISSIYSIVDMSMVGQYQGPDGTAALAVIAPIWNVIYSLGLLTGIGGSVLFSTCRGRKDGDENQYFTAAAMLSLVLALAAWAALWLWEAPILTFFGANETLLPLALNYMRPIRYVFPLFLLGQLLTVFLRNDGNPGLATASVLAGGVFNVFGDYFCVFTLDLGVYGAGLATAMGCTVSFLVMLTHFFRRKNTLRWVRVEKPLQKFREIGVNGFSTFFIDVAMGILTVLFNRQTMKYLNADALAVYGVIINVSTFVQCCAYSVGQATQPIMSVNFGAGSTARIRRLLRCALYTTTAFGVFWTALSFACPNLYIRVFMKPTENILAMAPGIIRRYAASFLLLPFNIYSTYYFQVILKPGAAFIVSVARGLVVSGLLILLLPAAFDAQALWFAMPITELLVAVYAAARMRSDTRALPASKT